MASCGTGLGNFPVAGDPDLNNAVLTASPVRGGISVRWTYPTVNSQGVSYVIIYRGTSSVFSNAKQHRIVGGDSYLDMISAEEPTTYYYWIKLVSVNTFGNPIGPASATVGAYLDDLMSLLEGRIADSALNASLREKITRIASLETLLAGETSSRLYSEEAFGILLARLQSDLEDVDTLIGQEVLERTTADSALVVQVNLILAKANDNAAAIIQERVARTDAHHSLASTIDTIAAKTDTNEGAIRDESTARTTAVNAVTLQVNTLQSSVGGYSSQIETLQQTYADLEGFLRAEHTLKVSAGRIASIGLRASNEESDIIMLADRFAVGSPSVGDKFPFTISTVNGETAIALNAATMIPDLSVGTLKIQGNSIMIPVFSSTSVEATVTTGGVTVLTYGFTVSGMEPGYAAGVILNASCTIYPHNASVATLGFSLRLNGAEVATAGASVEGYSVNAAMTGKSAIGNGHHTIQLMVNTSPFAGGGATKACTIVSNVTAMTGKR